MASTITPFIWQIETAEKLRLIKVDALIGYHEAMHWAEVPSYSGETHVKLPLMSPKNFHSL